MVLVMGPLLAEGDKLCLTGLSERRAESQHGLTLTAENLLTLAPFKEFL